MTNHHSTLIGCRHLFQEPAFFYHHAICASLATLAARLRAPHAIECGFVSASLATLAARLRAPHAIECGSVCH